MTAGSIARVATALTLAASSLATATGQTAPPAAVQAGPGYVLPDTETWELRGADNYPYQIFVSKPKGAPPPRGYPVLYVLDGNAMFAGFAEARRIQSMADADVAKSIIVGIGYQTELPYADRRLFDFTGGPAPQPWRDAFARLPNGGWDKFLDFLTITLRGEVDRRYRIDRDRQALFGHSLGGLLAIHALFTRPGAFHAIIAASPSLFWHQQEMLQEERAFAAALQAGKIQQVPRLMVVCGELEETAVERWDAEAFAQRMAALSGFGLRTRSEVYAGEGHLTVPSRAVPSTLRFAFASP